MQGNRRSDTVPEVGLRQLLHAAGFRFRKDFRIHVDGGQTRADIVFTRRRVAVFIDGCFWHGCPQHCRMPTRNRSYWEAKIGRNRERDAMLTAALSEGGWAVVRVWEHEPLQVAAAHIRSALSAR